MLPLMLLIRWQVCLTCFFLRVFILVLFVLVMFVVVDDVVVDDRIFASARRTTLDQYPLCHLLFGCEFQCWFPAMVSSDNFR